MRLKIESRSICHGADVGDVERLMLRQNSDYDFDETEIVLSYVSLMPDTRYPSRRVQKVRPF